MHSVPQPVRQACYPCDFTRLHSLMRRGHLLLSPLQMEELRFSYWPKATQLEFEPR